MKVGEVSMLMVRKNSGVSGSTAELRSPEGGAAAASSRADRLSSTRRGMLAWLVERRLALLIGLFAALPVIVSTIHGLSEGWYPYGDRAVIAARAFNVLSSHSPLVGQYSAWSTVLTRPIYSPGPTLYWLLAIPAHFLPAAGFVVWMGVMNVLCVLGIILLCRRRGGVPLMVVTAIALVLMCRSLNSESFHDIWDPTAPLLPLTLLFYVAWSIACGEYRLLPVAALLASFIIETHLAFVVATLGVLVIAVVGLVLAKVPDTRALRRWSLGAVAVTAVCWLPAILNQVFRPPGNLYLIADAVLNRKGTLGLSAGWHTVARAIGIPPWWLRSPVNGTNRWYQVIGAPPLGTSITALLIIAAVATLLFVALRRRNVEIASLTAIALVLVAALGFSTSSTPTQGILALTVGYTLWWASSAGMFVWVALGYGAARLFGGPLPASVGRAARFVAVPVAGIVAIIVALGLPKDADRGEYRAFGTVAARIDAALPHPGTVLVTADSTLQGFELQTAVVWALQRHGATVLLPRAATGNLGSSFIVGNQHYDHEVTIAVGHEPSGQVLARVQVNRSAPITGHYVVSLRPGSAR